MTKCNFTIEPATKEQADDIVRLIMTAMTDDCCLFFVGEEGTLDDFAKVMRRMVLEERSQYSYQNTLVALSVDNPKEPVSMHAKGCQDVAGVCVAYDGALLHSLREPFFRAMQEQTGHIIAGIDDETAAGEYYIDSLAVYPQYRRQGIASALLRSTAAKAHTLGLPAGLLVDKGNPSAERLYTSIGFRYVDDALWGGHQCKHLQWPCCDE